MLDVALSFMTEFIDAIPLLVCVTLSSNIISDLLWGGK